MPLLFVGPTELIIILLLAVLLFGASRLPQLGAGLGNGIRNFKNAISGKDEKKIEGDQAKNPDSVD